jgi:hypothetical protein
MKLSLPIILSLTSVSLGALSQADVTISPQDDGSFIVSGLVGNTDQHFPANTTWSYDQNLQEFVFKSTYEDGSGYYVTTDSSQYWYDVNPDKTTIQAYSRLVNDGNTEYLETPDLVTVTENSDGSLTVQIGKYETKNFPAGTGYFYHEKLHQYFFYLPDEPEEPEVQEDEDKKDEEKKEEKPEKPVIPELPKKIVVVHPTLAIHNVFRSNMFNVLNHIKPHQTVRSDKQYYVQSFKGMKTSHIETTTKELNTRVYIESASRYSNIKNKETLRQTGGTVGFDYENIGFCFTDLTGELNQYDLDSRLYSVYAGFNDQHKLVLSYGDHELENFDGDSYGALYEFNYNNFVADVAYTNTKFDQENLKTYMVGVGYTVAGNVVGPVNGSIKGMVIQDFGDHKDQYGAKQGSTGILVSGMLQTNLTENLGVYLMASGELRQHATGASAALGLELAF